MKVRADNALIHSLTNNVVEPIPSDSETVETVQKLENDITILHQENAYLARKLSKLENPKKPAQK